jgi:hypothetical protein
MTLSCNRYPPVPKNVPAFARRFRADTLRLSRLTHRRERVELKLQRSWTLIQAEQLGPIRFDELCRSVNLRGSPELSRHRLLAKGALNLRYVAGYLPDDDNALAHFAKCHGEKSPHDLYELLRKVAKSTVESG